MSTRIYLNLQGITVEGISKICVVCLVYFVEALYTINFRYVGLKGQIEKRQKFTIFEQGAEPTFGSNLGLIERWRFLYMRMYANQKEV